MSRGGIAHPGILAVGGLSALLVGIGLFVGIRGSDAPSVRRMPASAAPFPSPSALLPPPPVGSTLALTQGASAAEPADVGTVPTLVERFLDLLDPAHGDDNDDLARVVSELLSFGERATPFLVARLDRLPAADAARRDRILDLLRKLPGEAAEERLIREARAGRADSSRAIAIESLGERRTERAVQALGDIARTDPKVLERPLITSPRDPTDPSSTELPDEVVFTPRMQAMAALAATGDAQAVEILKEVLERGPDESLRMQAARSLEELRAQPGVAQALRVAAGTDASPYVRLAALHSLRGSHDASLAPALEVIAAADQDFGVRTLAHQVLADLRR